MRDFDQPISAAGQESEAALVADLVAEGDCGIIMKLDGSFRLFSTGVDEERLSGDPAFHTERDRAQIILGEKMMALVVALSNDQIMAILLDVTRNAIDPEMLRRAFASH